jgi:hypothetical protein
MRAANARVEWAMALVDLGDEDAAVAMATLALDPEWLGPDTERRTRILLRKMRDPRLRAQLTDQLHASWTLPHTARPTSTWAAMKTYSDSLHRSGASARELSISVGQTVWLDLFRLFAVEGLAGV